MSQPARWGRHEADQGGLVLGQVVEQLARERFGSEHLQAPADGVEQISEHLKSGLVRLIMGRTTDDPNRGRFFRATHRPCSFGALVGIARAFLVAAPDLPQSFGSPARHTLRPPR